MSYDPIRFVQEQNKGRAFEEKMKDTKNKLKNIEQKKERIINNLTEDINKDLNKLREDGI
tara:strand:+ start:325 stop:504 length:180 start_codon:yes stop_codon:yes gene_type:complete